MTCNLPVEYETIDFKSLFLIQHTNHSICSQCNQQITKSTAVVQPNQNVPAAGHLAAYNEISAAYIDR